MSVTLESLQGKTLTPDKKDLLANEIDSELKSINSMLSKATNSKTQTTAIQTNKNILQSVLNDLFAKRGIITPEETDRAITAINESKKARLQNDYYSSIKKYSVIIGVFVAVGVGLYLYNKNKSK